MRSMVIKPYVLSLAALLLMAGCSGRKLVYLPDGRAAYMVDCESAGWQSCYAYATKVCRPTGYELLQRQYERKVMYYRCKAAGEKRTEATGT